MNSTLRTPNSTLRTFILLLLIIIFQLYTPNSTLRTPNSELRTPNSELLYAQNLDVDGDLEINSTADTQRHGLILRPQTKTTEPTWPSCTQKGSIYYEDSNNQPLYCDGANWTTFGGTGAGGADKTVATRIVAAWNSLGSTQDGTPTGPLCLGNGTACSNPKADFTCDGTADQERIQDAINALQSNPGVVYLLEGTYNISGSINLNNAAPLDSGKAIIGTGAGTVLRATSSINVINAQNVSNILISQLRVDGNVTGNNGIYFNSVTYSKIDKVWVENMRDDAIELESSSNNNIISNNSILSNGDDGIDLDASSNNTIFGNSVQSNVNDGIDIETNSNNNDVSGNICWSNGSSGIDLDANSGNVISGNISWSNGDNGIDLAGVGGSDPVNNTVISGNTFHSNTNHGIKLNCSNHNTITGNNVSSNGRHGINLDPTSCPNNPSSSNNIISGNVVSDNGVIIDPNAEGIRIQENSDNNIVSSNLLFDSSGAGYPIQISGTTSDNNYLVGNLVSTWPVGYERINDSGTNTRYTDKIKVTLERAAVLTVSSSTITLPSPISYLPVVSSGGQRDVTTITATNKPIGDLLILEGTSDTNTVNIQNTGNVKCASNRLLGLDDVLTLIWNGTNWIELHWANN